LLQAIFWFTIFSLFYIYIGYPIMICLLALCSAQHLRKYAIQANVSVVIVAYNEADVLPRKIDSILNSDGASRIKEILIASDGSTDATQTIVGNASDPRVRLLAFSERRGKPSVLNDAIASCTSDIVVLTDARQELNPAAINELVANFADESVGVVSGELIFRQPEGHTTAAHGLDIYWTYEKFIRKNEARFRSVPGATGALYAIRRHLFRPIHALTLLDDVVIPMQAIVQGYRCIFESAAIAYDTPSQIPEKESIRKRRTIAGAAQLIEHHPEWLLPWCNPIWIEYVSHKLCRLFSPLLLITAVVTNFILATASDIERALPHVYAMIFSVHLGFYLSALAGWVFQRAGRRSVCFGAQMMFCALNVTTMAALWDAVNGRFQATWRQPSDRVAFDVKRELIAATPAKSYEIEK
jgi:glycosyltransferase involved in cell wall biosynthesis